MPVVILLFLMDAAIGQSTKRALFLGNSYTGNNNLPAITKSFALSLGDTLVTDMNAPGGYTLQGHFSNTTSLNKIQAGNWDFVVLQEQSQLPSFPDSMITSDVFPYAHKLDSVINLYNHCCETVFYMTWGRKNGDNTNCAEWPPVCTYAGMDSLLYKRYMEMTEQNNAVVSPVGAVWKYIREQYPAIELYASDNSHPSPAGSFAAACCFATVLFQKDPTLSGYNYTIPSTDAALIKEAVKSVVYNNLTKWKVGSYTPSAAFNYTKLNETLISFVNQSSNGERYSWQFGDGQISAEENPSHHYLSNGNYMVSLTVSKDCFTADTIAEQITIAAIDSVITNTTLIYPNPVSDFLVVNYTLPAIKNAKLFNAVGQQLQTNYFPFGDLTKIDMKKFPAGIYFLVIRTDASKKTFKILKR